jgi:ABC-type transporter Mla subunit MlaD
MAEYRRAEITSGLFIVLSLLLFALFSFKIGGLSLDDLFSSSGAEFYCYFDDVKTLDVNAKVSIGGTPVGRVTKRSVEMRPLAAADVQRLRDSGLDVDGLGIKAGGSRPVVRLDFAITDANVRFGDAAFVKVEQEGFIGPFFLALYPEAFEADKQPPPVIEAPRRTTPVRAAPGAGLLDDFRAKFAPTLKSIDGILHKFDTVILSDDNEEHMAALIPLLRSDLEEAQALLRNLKRMADPADADGLHATVLRPAGRMLSRLDGTAARVDDLVRDAAPEVRRLLENAASAASEGERTLAALRGIAEDSAPRLRSMMNEVESLLQALAAKRKEIQALVDQGKRLATEGADAAAGASAMIGENRANLAEMMRTMRSLMWDAEVLMRKLRANPAVVIWGDDEPVLDAEPRDATGIRQSGRAKPYDQRGEGEVEGSLKPAPERKKEDGK